MAYDVSNIIQVAARIGAPGLGLSNFGQALLLANDTDKKGSALTWAANTFKEFNKADGLLDYFDTTAEAYKAATMYFSITPKPLSLKIWLRDSANDTAVASLAKAADKTWFYWFDVTQSMRASVNDYVAIQSWAGANNKLFATTSASADILNSGLTNDAMSQMKSAGVRHSFLEYHPTNSYAGLQTAALYARVNYSAPNSVITAFGKKKPGLTAIDLGNSEYQSLKSKGAVFYTKVEAGGSIDDGRVINPFTTSSYGETIDDVVDTDAMINAMEVGLYSYLMSTPTKRPQTVRGQAGAIDAVAQVLEQYYSNGFLGPRQYTDEATGEQAIAEHGYVITTRPEDIYKLSDVDRAAHKLYPISVRAFRAGAAFEISVTVDVE